MLYSFMSIVQVYRYPGPISNGRLQLNNINLIFAKIVIQFSVIIANIAIQILNLNI